MIQIQLITRILRKSTPALMATVMAIGLLASASRGHAQATLIWTNGSDNWNSATAWQTNLFTAYTNEVVGLVTNQVTNSLCVVVLTDPNSIVVTNCAGGLAIPPSGLDSARFTNSTNPKITITSSTNVALVSFLSNAVVTLSAPASTLTVTTAFRVAQSSSTTATVYWSGGTLAAANGGAAGFQVATGTGSVGEMFVTNGTVMFEKFFPSSSVGRGFQVGEKASRGKLVISNSGLVTNVLGGEGSISVHGGATTGSSELIITNGGKLIIKGSTHVISNGTVLASGPGSEMYHAAGTIADSGNINLGAAAGPGSSLLIVSNGAKVTTEGTITIGRTGSAANTGIVVGAGSRLIGGLSSLGTTGSIYIGASAGADKNDLLVYDGGYINSGGPIFSIGNSATCKSNSFHMGGTGAMSTGIVVAVRNNSGSQYSMVIVTNAILSCSQFSSLGLGNNILSVLDKGTLAFTNEFLSPNSPLTNVLSFSAPLSTFTINAGTVSTGSGSNVNATALVGILLGSGAAGSGCSMSITNGGKLLTELFTIGSSSSYGTGIVTGASSVWSNYTAGAGFINTNRITVGDGTTANGNNNYLAIQNGARLVNNGSLQIGDSGSTTANSVLFGGDGAPAVIINSGMINIGGSGGTSGNTLTITNASVTCDALNVGGTGSNRVNNTVTILGGTVSANSVLVRSTNTLVFTAGTLSAGSMDIKTDANGSNVFVVGDGTSAAYYDMAAGGSGYHEFANGGIVLTNGTSLSGNGTITGTIKTFGTFTPGYVGSVGSILTSNSLTFSGAAVLNFDLGTSSDLVTVKGNLALGSSTLNVSNSGGFAAATYLLFQHTNTLTAPSGAITTINLPAGFTAVVSNDLPNSQVLLVVSAVGGGDPYVTWQGSYGLTGGNALGTADPDGDGVSNTNEFLTGFNPTNAAAYAHVISVAKSGSIDMNITYLGANGDSTWSPGVAARTNVLQFTTGTANGSYSNNFADTGVSQILSNGTGVGLTTNMVDTGGATNVPSRYYRIKVLTP